MFRRQKPTNYRLKPCLFCTEKKEPDFKEVEVLRRYLSERGKILGKDRTGICNKHQKRLTLAIKRSRFLSLLPFTVKAR